ncbi:alkaline phosphatase D family protein [Nostoc sp. CMAA1605]|uniref:alkaline phosphatase D family protein n=1 Tax=Nostoc sp. CMAA1605 TaxID=2055159 RepID=UPI001F458F9F|nr:alkaline phosphatase D family protein [Nostoc sp. CMAA1605]MCF4970425.1 PhoD-like phosphatase [Nostoc sp. CMAA1605]
MNNLTGSFLDDLPIILAGPILKHTDSKSVTVLVVLKQACQVVLKVYDTIDDGERLNNCLLIGQRYTVALGKHLHVVAVTAVSGNGENLTSHRIYAYDLEFTLPNQTTLSLEQALSSPRFPYVNISYFQHQKPTFILPPHRLEDLHIIHASCRKPQGHGFDALPILDSLIATTKQIRDRPQQLFLTGDQIYGDDVADAFLWYASPLGDILLGWEEQLPIGHTDRTPQELPAGTRAKLATVNAGFTAGLHNKSEKVSSHLFSLGEYYAAYILAWSPICWPDTFPDVHTITQDPDVIKFWQESVKYLRQFMATLPQVRRVLANIPTYTIFDDHDVSDDWNLNQAWCLRVLGNPLGRRVVQNALLAYAVFQAWGNTPEQFAKGENGENLLKAAAAWSHFQGKNENAEKAIARYVGIPSINPHTNLPNFVLEDGVFTLERDPQVLTWNYTVTSNCHQVIVLDTRTWRGYPADAKPIAPPMLLSPSAMQQQLQAPLQQTAHHQHLTSFVIAPTNVFGLQVIDWIHHWQLKREKVFSTDVGDAWNIHFPALARLLTTLCEQRQKLIILSGDIHYSCTAKLAYTRTRNPQQPSVLVQLTASALKNEEPITRIIHTRLKNWLLPEKKRYWIGWNQPPNLREISARKLRHHQAKNNPDWYCLLEWIPRQSTKNFYQLTDISGLVPAHKPTINPKWRWLAPLMFWRSRWFQDGREVVGVNNIASVHFDLTAVENDYQVIHDIYWFDSICSNQVVYSRFSTNFQPNNKS